MTLSEELIRIKSIFIDTAPIIYYMEAHPQFGPLAREVVSALTSDVNSGHEIFSCSSLPCIELSFIESRG